VPTASFHPGITSTAELPRTSAGAIGDRLGRRVPKAHDATTIDEKHPVGDVGHDPCRVCPLLDLAIEPATIDCERETTGEILCEGEIVRTVGLGGARSCERQRSKCPLPRRKGRKWSTVHRFHRESRSFRPFGTRREPERSWTSCLDDRPRSFFYR
jgi:hypothetical protein